MLCWIDSDGVSNHDVAELADLRKRTDGFLWLDIAEWSEEAEAMLTNEFHFHPMAITESKSLQLRGEMFNATNHPNWGNPGTVLGSSSFGIITSNSNLPRQVQIGLKLRY